MESEHDEKKVQKEILDRLTMIESDLRVTQEAISRIRKFMFWRLIVLLLAILIPSIAIPFFFKSFATSYLTALQSVI